MGKALKICCLGSSNQPALAGRMPGKRRVRGFTAVELMVTVAIVIITVAMAIPLIQNANKTLRLRSSVASLTGVMQQARYQAISHGFQYQLILNKAASTYQLQSNACINPAPACWANVGGAVPLSGSSAAATISADTTLLFSPSGLVQATTGAQTFTLTYSGSAEVFTVTNYGKITVAP